MNSRTCHIAFKMSRFPQEAQNFLTCFSERQVRYHSIHWWRSQWLLRLMSFQLQVDNSALLSSQVGQRRSYSVKMGSSGSILEKTCPSSASRALLQVPSVTCRCEDVTVKLSAKELKGVRFGGQLESMLKILCLIMSNNQRWKWTVPRDFVRADIKLLSCFRGRQASCTREEEPLSRTWSNTMEK